MAAHYCICPKCNKKFNRDKVQAVKVSARRYGHATCYPDNKDFVPLVNSIEEDEDYIKLKDYINKLFGKNANWAQINRQIKIYTNENNYSLSGILKSLVYFYEVKGNSVDKANGALGIVPFVYNDAYNYYYSLFIAQQQNQNKDIKQITNKVKEIIIKTPEIFVKKRMFNFLDEDEEIEEEEV